MKETSPDSFFIPLVSNLNMKMSQALSKSGAAATNAAAATAGTTLSTGTSKSIIKRRTPPLFDYETDSDTARRMDSDECRANLESDDTAAEDEGNDVEDDVNCLVLAFDKLGWMPHAYDNIMDREDGVTLAELAEQHGLALRRYIFSS